MDKLTFGLTEAPGNQNSVNVLRTGLVRYYCQLFKKCLHALLVKKIYEST